MLHFQEIDNKIVTAYTLLSKLFKNLITSIYLLFFYGYKIWLIIITKKFFTKLNVYFYKKNLTPLSSL